MKKIILLFAFTIMAIAPNSHAWKVGNSGFHVCYAKKCYFVGPIFDFIFLNIGPCPTEYHWQGTHCSTVSELGVAGQGATYVESHDTHGSINSSNMLGFDIEEDRVNCINAGTSDLASIAHTSTQEGARFTDSCTNEYVDYDDHFTVSDGVSAVNVPL